MARAQAGLVRYVHSRIMHHGDFSIDLGLLALKTETQNFQPKEGKQVCNLVGKMITVC